MKKEEKHTLIKYRLERADEALKAAQLMLDNKYYISAMNRIYYSMFYAVTALSVLHDCSFSRHGQIKSYFNREFIKSGIFPKEFGKLFNVVFEYRQKFDYVDLVNPEEILVSDYIVKANQFIDKISRYIQLSRSQS